MVKKSTQATLILILSSCAAVTEIPDSFTDNQTGRLASASSRNDSAIMTARRKVADSQKLESRSYRALSSSSVGMSASGLDGQMRPSVSFDLLKYLQPETRLAENLAKLREAEQQHQDRITRAIEELKFAQRSQELARGRLDELARRNRENEELHKNGLISRNDLEDGKHAFQEAQLAHEAARSKGALRAYELAKYER